MSQIKPPSKESSNFYRRRPGYEDLPLFLLLRSIPKVGDRSKIFRIHLLDSYRIIEGSTWMDEILERYVRRFKPLAADALEISIKFINKYGYAARYLRLPKPYKAIGYLIVRRKGCPISATGCHHFNQGKPIAYAARERDKKINEKSFLNKKLSAKEREFFILRTELKAYLIAERSPWKAIGI